MSPHDDGDLPAAATADHPFSDGWLRRVMLETEAELADPGASPAELELARLRALLRTSFSHAPIGMTVLNAAGRLVVANEALCVTLGQSAEAVVGRALSDLVDAEDRESEALDRARLTAHEIPRYTADVRLVRADESRVWTRLTVATAGGEPPTLIYQVEDVTDGLTGLFNRRRFEQELSQELERHARTGEGGAVLMLDLDGFKEVNDQFGHAAGDRLLQGLSEAMKARVRNTDVLARLGGDEFAVLLPEASGSVAEGMAGELLTIIARHTDELGPAQAGVTASIGVALLGGHGDAGGRDPLTLADSAMYTAKQGGRNRFAVSGPAARSQC